MEKKLWPWKLWKACDLESSSLIRLRFSFFISFVLKKPQVKIWKVEIKIQVIFVYKHLIIFFTIFFSRQKDLELQ